MLKQPGTGSPQFFQAGDPGPCSYINSLSFFPTYGGFAWPDEAAKQKEVVHTLSNCN